MPERRLPPPAVVALDVIALMGARRLPASEFEFHMLRRGCDQADTAAALASLERRAWAQREGGVLEISESGYAAAIRGAKAVRPRRAPKVRSRRMPAGLF